mmetsp:Transcript_40143/g.94353  ORF Transcript_40143/g.94353 Transcript_40143/m.94353 type:complete len:200 (+) Transcript_40143:46-645(+)
MYTVGSRESIAPIKSICDHLLEGRRILWRNLHTQGARKETWRRLVSISYVRVSRVSDGPVQPGLPLQVCVERPAIAVRIHFNGGLVRDPLSSLSFPAVLPDRLLLPQPSVGPVCIRHSIPSRQLTFEFEFVFHFIGQGVLEPKRRFPWIFIVKGGDESSSIFVAGPTNFHPTPPRISSIARVRVPPVAHHDGHGLIFHD